jgi:hypothetical protein
MYYSYVAIEYVATSFSPARTDLALKLSTNIRCGILKDWYLQVWYFESYHIHGVAWHMLIIVVGVVFKKYHIIGVIFKMLTNIRCGISKVWYLHVWYFKSYNFHGVAWRMLIIVWGVVFQKYLSIDVIFLMITNIRYGILKV